LKSKRLQTERIFSLLHTMNNLNTGTRLATMLLDHFIMGFAATIVAAPGVIYDIAQNLAGAPPKLFLGNYYLNIFAFMLYFNKDIISGRSPAKRILKLQVVNAKTNTPANPLRCLLRNITVVLWPIEVIAALINNERRIGDYIAGTRLTTYSAEQHKEDRNWALIFAAVVAGLVVTYFTMFFPMEVIMRGSGFAAGLGE
jgi:uncharacterized RDD family membrane protein YckC